MTTTSSDKDKLDLLVKQRATSWLAGQDTREAKRLCFTARGGAEQAERMRALGLDTVTSVLRAHVKVFQPCRIADFWAWDTNGYSTTVIRTIACERAGKTAWFVALEVPTMVYSRGSPAWPREGELGKILEGDDIIVEVALTRPCEWAGLFLCHKEGA